MCGRYTLVDVKNLPHRFGITEPSIELHPSLNISPGTNQPVIFEQHNQRHLDMMRWGLIPRWAKDEKIGYRLINARAETVEQKPAFRNSLMQRRCVIPANGFYEWHKQPKKNQPYYFSLEKNELMALAGLWDSWQNSDGETLSTFTILTRQANPVVASIHERMPLILAPEQEAVWLRDTTTPQAIHELLNHENALNLRSTKVTTPLEALS
jgi:putative SOS response-associated peptidase YedK